MSNTNRKISPKGHISDLNIKLEKKKYKFPGTVPDGSQATPHYISGEYPGSGWAETFPPSNSGRNKKISNRIKRSREKQAMKKNLKESDE